MRIFFYLCGIACLLAIMPIAIAMWKLLQPGDYPTILIGLPALPLLWLSAVFFKRSGLDLEGFARRNPRFFNKALYLVFTALALVSLIVLAELGML